MKTAPVLLHIPHSEDKIPFKDGYVVSNAELEAEMLKLTDWKTYPLFGHYDNSLTMICPFNRIFCDVERFEYDEDEVMAPYGMGAVYEKLDNGAPLRELTPELKEKIMIEYYWSHHYNNVNKKVKKSLDEFGVANILDCHSFPDEPFQRDLEQSKYRPDICIGTDAFHTPKKWIEYAYKLFSKNGLRVWIDKPYKGTFVPSHHLGQTKEVRSMMIEVNRKLYLKEGTNEFLEGSTHNLPGLISELVRGISFLGSSGQYLE